MPINDIHCHFFSSGFLGLLTKDLPGFPEAGRAAAVARQLGWEDPGSPADLADRWAAELDRHGVARAALIASIPGDEASVADAIARHPSRFVGFFMFNPTGPDAESRLTHALSDLHLKGICLFPAMHRYALDDERVVKVFEAARARGALVFAHCGVLTVGVRKKLGLPSLFDWRLGDPLALASVAARFPEVPVVIPHFGAGFFREALMAADQCPSIHLDTSSSNGWIKYYPGLTLTDVFRQALAVAGPDRVLFGTDSSFYPRGWQQPVYAAQLEALAAIRATHDVRTKVLGGTFDRLFGR